MKVSSVSGARGATLPAATQAAPEASLRPKPRPAAMSPPPPRATSFGGADPRAMFEALVAQYDSSGDGQLSVDEIAALNKGGLLSGNFAQIDSNADGRLTGGEIAAMAPWGAGGLPSDDRGSGQRGTDVQPLLDRLNDHLNASRDANGPAGSIGAAPGAGFIAGMSGGGPANQTLTRPDPASTTAARGTLMQSMVLALSGTDPDQAATVTALVPQTHRMR